MNRKTFNGLLVFGAVIGVFVWAILVNVVMDVTGIPQETQESISFGLGMPGGLICGFLAYKFWRDE